MVRRRGAVLIPFREKWLEEYLNLLCLLRLHCRNDDLIHPGITLLICTDQLRPFQICACRVCLFTDLPYDPLPDRSFFTHRALDP